MRARYTSSTRASMSRLRGQYSMFIPFVSLLWLAVLLIPSGPLSAAHCNPCIGNYACGAAMVRRKS